MKRNIISFNSNLLIFVQTTHFVKIWISLQSLQRGGKGTPRRNKKVVHKTVAVDEKKFQGAVKKLGVNSIPGIEQVNFFKADGTVTQFKEPIVQGSVTANTFIVSGPSEDKNLTEILPSVIDQMGPEAIKQLQALMQRGQQFSGAKEGDDEIPDLEETPDFETVSNA